MIKHGLEIVDECENYIINNFIDRNEIKRNSDYKVKFIKISIVKNVSAYILIKYNFESISVSKNRKKAKNYYCEVVFAGLRQPTKKISIATYKVLSLFINRFKVNDIDICFDGENETPINKDNIRYFYNLFNEYINSFSKEEMHKTSFYINAPASVERDTDVFKKMLAYDKYIKESRYKDLDESLQNWKRLEVTVRIEFKYKDFILDDYLNDIEIMAKRYFNSSSFTYEYFYLQHRLLTDKRTHRGIKSL